MRQLDEPTAEPTEAPTLEPTVEPTPEQITFDFDNAPDAFVCNIDLRNSDAVRGDRLVLTLDRVRQPALDAQYVAWAQIDGELVFVDTLAVEDGRVAFESVVPTPLDGTVIGQFERLLITEEPVDAPLDAPTGEAIFDGAVEADALETLRSVSADLTNADTQLLLAIDHRNLMQQSLDAGDLTGALRHAEHVLNILAVDLFGDMDGSGLAENPGDDVGVRRYVEQASTASGGLVANAERFVAPNERLVAALASATEQVDLGMGEGTRMFATDSAEEATAVSEKLDGMLLALQTDILAAADSTQTLFARHLADDVNASAFGGSVALVGNGAELMLVAPDLLAAPCGVCQSTMDFTRWRVR